MGLLDFVKDAGAKLSGKAKAEERAKEEAFAELRKGNTLMQHVIAMGLEIEGMKINYDDGVAAIRGSRAFVIEQAYARRGGFEIRDDPRFVASLGEDWILAGYESDARIIQAGSIAGLIVHHHLPSGETLYAHCLVAGPEAEITAVAARPLLDLPSPGSIPARKAYASWRKEAWSRFWLVELEDGIRAASEEWIASLWTAMNALYGAEDGKRTPQSLEHARSAPCS